MKVQMKTYLLTWNPDRWSWKVFAEEINKLRQDGFVDDHWSCGNNRRIEEGDRIFLLRQAKEPRGIAASGWAISDVYEDEYFDPKADKATALYIRVRFDVLLDSDKGTVYPRQNLDAEIFANAGKMHWDTQVSGVRIPANVAEVLENEWSIFLEQHGISRIPKTIFPDEITIAKNYYEGAVKSVQVNIYERNAQARADCIKRYGCNCVVCGFNFEEVYGALGTDFIHVHHLKPLSGINQEYEVDPIKDLRPVCPNCHAMIHRRKPAYSIEEMRQQLKTQ